MSERRLLSKLEIKSLMLDVLGDKEFCKVYSGGYNFQDTRGAHQDNLFEMVERMAISKNLIKEDIPISKIAWGASRRNLCENYNTNFKKKEIEILWEIFYIFLNNNIIAPGWYRQSPDLPFFHITEHGLNCIDRKDILPYDVDGYVNKLSNIDGLDEWVEFYTLEAMRCYNSNCYNASTAMIGLASETLIEIILHEFSILLGKYCDYYKPKQYLKLGNKTIKQYFDEGIRKNNKISKKYKVFVDCFKGIENIQNELFNIIDISAMYSFFTYLRLNRNEVSHPSQVKKEDIETLLLFIGFTRYCETMTKMILKMKELNQ